MKHLKSASFASIVGILFTSQAYCHVITAQISFGELIDKITILTIKSERITNETKLRNVHTELEALQKIYEEYIGNRPDALQLQELLKQINELLWEIEDAIRVKERKKEFDAEFIELARNVYITNDKRCVVKKEIDTLLGSHITEEKSYEELV